MTLNLTNRPMRRMLTCLLITPALLCAFVLGLSVPPAEAARRCNGHLETATSGATTCGGGVGWTTTLTTMAINTTAVRTGSNGLHVASLGSANDEGCQMAYRTASATGVDYLRCYI